MPRRGTTPPITTNNPQNTRPTKPDQTTTRPPTPQSRMQFPQSLRPERRQNSRISTICCDTLKCLEGNCMRNFFPADERSPQGLRTHIHTFTVNAFGDSPAALPRKNSPSTARSATAPRKTSPSTLENSIFRPFGLAGRTFSRSHPLQVAQGELFRA